MENNITGLLANFRIPKNKCLDICRFSATNVHLQCHLKPHSAVIFHCLYVFLNSILDFMTKIWHLYIAPYTLLSLCLPLSPALFFLCPLPSLWACVPLTPPFLLPASRQRFTHIACPWGTEREKEREGESFWFWHSEWFEVECLSTSCCPKQSCKPLIVESRFLSSRH